MQARGQTFSAPAFKLIPTAAEEANESSSGFTSSFFEEQKFNEISAVSSASESSYGGGSHVTMNISVGLSGLAGKPNLSMNESEQWIMDPRTPVKKFANLLFKLASIR